MKLPVLYRITYIPWVDNLEGKPWYYSGSNYTDNESYYGSLSGNKVTFWSNNMTTKQWWKNETGKYKFRFKKDIIKSFDNISLKELREEESRWQSIEDHKNDPRYFNNTNQVTYPWNMNGPFIPWNKGLTKSDPRVLNNIEKMTITRQNQDMGFWITNGIENLKYFDEDNIPDGFYKGRTVDHLDPYKGANHSQYKSFWVTNGVDNLKIKDGNIIPPGYFRGRVNVRKRKGDNNDS